MTEQARDVRFSAGDTVGEYRLVRHLGTGGMGQVWLAEHSSLTKPVALKFIRAEVLDDHHVALFAREARAGGRLAHPGIVNIFGTGAEAGLHWMVMEYVPGGRTLATELSEGRRTSGLTESYRGIAELFAEIAEAMQVAHQAGVIHRDLKPENILLTVDDHPKITDFGIARIEEETAISKTMLHAGSLHYMSPEQAMAKSLGIDRRTDVFSLGAVLYEFLTGRRAFDGDSAVQVLENIVYVHPPDPRQIRSQVPRDLVVICGKALEKQRGHRYSTMGELAADLRRYLANQPIHAQPPGPLRKLELWARRNPTKSVAGSIGALAFVAISGLFAANLRTNKELERTILELDSKNENLLKALAREHQAKAEAERADLSAARARSNEEKAIARRAEAEEERVKVLRLSDVSRLATFEDDAELLWPATPDRIPEYEAWLGRAEQQRGRLELHRQALSEVRAGAVATSGDPEDRRWFFASTEERWQHDSLSELVVRLEDFTSETGLIVDVRARLEFAGRVEELTVSGDEAQRLWTDAIAAIADPDGTPAYAGLELTPQLGLLPIGPDPASGLWEFVHVQSGEVPERDKGGQLVFTEETGIVLVLLPDGIFLRGAQSADLTAPNYDPQAARHESPVEEIALDPFFTSKFEMTQGQWLRFTGENPSNYDPERSANADLQLDLTNPVEQVSWRECETVLGNLGLTLPTEAQWEYAARAGTSTPWWTGETRDSLVGAGNFADQTAARAGATWAAISAWPELDDGFPFHAPVGTFEASQFGLHDVHGNVFEWCLDWYGPYGEAIEEGTGLREPVDFSYHVYRGGGYIYSDDPARSGARDGNVPDYKGSSVGVRPARRIDP